MVRLNPEQTAIKRKIEAQKKGYDAALAEIEAAYVSEKEKLKDPLRQLVAEAEAAGIPQRQIHLAFGFAQLSSLVSFLLPSKRAGGSLLYTGRTQTTLNPVAEAAQRAANTKPEFVQKPGEAHWIDPHTGEARVTDRLDGPVYFYYMNDATLATLTEEEREWFANDAKTLMGTDEYDRYMNDGDEPERWETQPDAKMRR